MQSAENRGESVTDLVTLTSRSDSDFERSNVSLKENKPDGVNPNSNDIDYYIRKNEGKVLWFSADCMCIFKGSTKYSSKTNPERDSLDEVTGMREFDTFKVPFFENLFRCSSCFLEFLFVQGCNSNFYRYGSYVFHLFALQSRK